MTDFKPGDRVTITGTGTVMGLYDDVHNDEHDGVYVRFDGTVWNSVVLTNNATVEKILDPLPTVSGSIIQYAPTGKLYVHSGLSGWRSVMTGLLAHIESSFDFNQDEFEIIFDAGKDLD